MKTKLLTISLFVVTIGVTLIVAEVFFRFLVVETPDGNRVLMGRYLRPYQMPKNEIKAFLEQYSVSTESNTAPIRIGYDSLVGYKPNPLYNLPGGSAYNEQSIRVSQQDVYKKVSSEPDSNSIRIALFGDSFTHDDGVSFEASWGSLLQTKLINKGFQCEVFNFGMGGYGLDQAYLRWEYEGKLLNPHIVILGFYTLDIERSLRVVKGFPNGGLLFSKPRFVFDQDSSLKLINSPTLSPEIIFSNVNTLDDYPLVSLNYDYEELKDDYENRWFRNSILLSFIEDIWKKNRFTYLGNMKPMYDFNSEPASLGLGIIKKFSSSVTSEKTSFLVVDLPKYMDMQSYILNETPLAYQNMLDSIGNYCELVETINAFDDFAAKHEEYDLFARGEKESFFVANGHYSGLATDVISDTLSEFIAARLDLLVKK